MIRNDNRVLSLDFWSILLYFLLLAWGWANIYAVDFRGDAMPWFDLSTQHGKQLLWIAVSLFMGMLLLIIDQKFYATFAYFFYGMVILMLIAVLFLAPAVKGAHSWFQIGSFKLQPSELAKFATLLALARYLTGVQANMKYFKTKILALSIIMLPAIFILMQPDPGSVLVYLGLIIVLYREAFPLWPFLILMVLAILFLLTIWLGPIPVLVAVSIIFLLTLPFVLRQAKKRKSRLLLLLLLFGLTGVYTQFGVKAVFQHVLKEHHKNRINVLLGKAADRGADYNVTQSKIAIGSGGLTGKGFLKGTMTKGEFVPEQSTDFIFSTLGEEWGFLGSGVLVLLFMAFMLRIIFLAERQRSRFSKIYAYGVLSIFLVHIVVNISMALGIFPVVGIPLPFFSYGGSSLLGFSIMFFILLNFDANRKTIFR